MDRTRTVARSLLSTATAMATSLTLAALPAAPGGAATGTAKLLAKALPDECFGGEGLPSAAGCEFGVPKVNQAYVWGLAKSDERLWFGTGPNVHCLTIGSSLVVTEPIITDDYVCEYGESPQRVANPAIPAAGGDWRPPKIYLYDQSTQKLIDKTEAVKRKSIVDRELIESTVGIRAAGAHEGVVFLAGPGVIGVNLFAFDGASGEYLGSKTFAEYGNIRSFLVADGALYTGVGMGPEGVGGGAVLRWAGSRADPFAFDFVASLPGQVADLTLHEGRMFVTTWPSGGRFDKGITAGVWMSPPLADGEPGLATADVAAWTRVWDVTQYEPDPVIAATYYLGGLASYGGDLYWGTMNVPMRATEVYAGLLQTESTEQADLITKNTQRTASLFRARNFDNGRADAEMLYGEAALPAFNPETNAWQPVPTGYLPRYGAAGFGNSYNNYIWKMSVAGGKLYIGTMDWSYLRKDLPAELGDPVQEALGPIDPAAFGGDLWAFTGPDGPATPVSTTGLGNYLNYGVRTMVADGPNLYLGMANPMNLRTDKTDDVPEGGWELRQLPVAGS